MAGPWTSLQRTSGRPFARAGKETALTRARSRATREGRRTARARSSGRRSHGGRPPMVSQLHREPALRDRRGEVTYRSPRQTTRRMCVSLPPHELITGSSTGFGRDAAERLARRGDHVFATMRDVGGRNAEHRARTTQAPTRSGRWWRRPSMSRNSGKGPAAHHLGTGCTRAVDPGCPSPSIGSLRPPRQRANSASARPRKSSSFALRKKWPSPS